MPKRSVLDLLSGSETDDETPDPNQERGGKHASDPKSILPRKDSEVFQRSLLGSTCGCKHKKSKNCLQQFVAGENFRKLLEYRSHWFELEKVDQDNYAVASGTVSALPFGAIGLGQHEDHVPSGRRVAFHQLELGGLTCVSTGVEKATQHGRPVDAVKRSAPTKVMPGVGSFLQQQSKVQLQPRWTFATCGSLIKTRKRMSASEPM